MKDATKSPNEESLMIEDKNNILGKNCLKTKLNLTYLLIIYIPFYYLHRMILNIKKKTKIIIQKFLLNHIY